MGEMSKYDLKPIQSAKRRRLAKADGGYGAIVYFIESGKTGLTKIGRTRRAVQRIDCIARDNLAAQDEMRYHGYIKVTPPVDVSLEYALHCRFRDLRAHGEWFDLSGENVLDAAISVCRAVIGSDFEVFGLSSDETKVQHDSFKPTPMESRMLPRRSLLKGTR